MRAGVQEGMSLAHARALLPSDQLWVEPFAPQADVAALGALAEWAVRFSPRVAADVPPDGLLLDITGCQRLFGGERRLVDRVADSVRRLGFGVRVAAAPTFGCARAVARFGRSCRSIIPRGAVHTVLGPLPVGALRIDQATVGALAEVGIQRLAHLFALPRPQLVERFGPGLLGWRDQATGRALETIEPIRPAEPPRVQQQFDGPTNRSEAVEAATQQLVAELSQRLERLERGARRLSLELHRVDREPARLGIELGRPSRDPKHLWSLIRPGLERVDLGFGVEAVVLSASRIGRLGHEQLGGLLPAEASDASAERFDRQFGELLDLWAGRLGRQRIVRLESVSTHLPERAFGQRPVLETDQAGVPWVADRHPDRPSVLLDRPDPIQVVAATPDGPPSWLRWRGVEHRVRTAIGPHRIAGEWWKQERHEGTEARRHEGGRARDYFKVEEDSGRWLWVFRELATGRWFVHGQWA